MIRKQIEDELTYIKELNKSFEKLLYEYVSVDKNNENLVKQIIIDNIKKNHEVLDIEDDNYEVSELDQYQYRDVKELYEYNNKLETLSFFISNYDLRDKVAVKLLNIFRQEKGDVFEKIVTSCTISRIQNIISSSKVINLKGACYIEAETADGKVIYKCFSADKDSLTTYNEKEAMKWVVNKNNSIKTIPKTEQIKMSANRSK